MRPIAQTFLAVAAVMLMVSCLVAQDVGSDVSMSTESQPIQVPAWAEVATVVMVLAGMVVLVVALGAWVVRGRTLRQVRENFTPWGLLEVFVLAGTWLLFKSAPAVLADLVGWSSGGIPVWSFVVADGAGGMTVVGLALWIMHARYGLERDGLGLRRENPWAVLALVPAGLVAIMPIQALLTGLYQRFDVQVSQEVVQRFLVSASGPDLALACLLTLVMAPVFEEFLFRAVLQMGLRKYLGPWGAILVGGVVFAAVHPPWPVSLMIFPLGVVLGIIYQRRQSLVAPILLHMLFNSFSVFVLVGNKLI